MNAQMLPKRFIAATAALALLALACNLLQPKTPEATQPPSTVEVSEPVIDESSALPTRDPSQRGQGSFDLPDLLVGLDGLNSYTAQSTTRFEGQQDGQPANWTRSLEMQFVRQPHAYLWTMEMSGPGSESVSLMNAELPGVRYRVRSYPGSEAGDESGQPGIEEPCTAQAVAAGEPPAGLIEPASALPPVYGAEATGATETVNGIETLAYTFDERALGLEGQGQASGEVWVSAQGGFVVKYHLELDAAEDVLGPGMQGRLVWDYSLETTNQGFAITPPPGCPGAMVDAPLPPGSGEVTAMPGYQGFTTTSDQPSTLAFYQDQLPALGWEPVGEPSLSEDTSRLVYTRGEESLTIWIEGSAPTSVMILSSFGEAPSMVVEPQPTPTLTAETAQVMDVSMALSLLSGTGDTPSVFSSYHLEINQTTPTGDAGEQTYALKADVEGENVYMHETTTAPGQGAQVLEGYLIGDQEYTVVNGVAQPSFLAITMAWIGWPLGPTTVLSMAATGLAPLPSESIDGLPARVYSVDLSRADPESLKMLRDTGMFPYLEITGTIWVDQDTGALLKADLDYVEEIKNPDTGEVTGSGPGTLDISVTQVGKVSVSLP